MNYNKASQNKQGKINNHIENTFGYLQCNLYYRQIFQLHWLIYSRVDSVAFPNWKYYNSTSTDIHRCVFGVFVYRHSCLELKVLFGMRAHKWDD